MMEIEIDDLEAIKQACKRDLDDTQEELDENAELQNKFDKIDKAISKESRLLDEKILIESQSNENALLKRYIKILAELEKINKLQDDAKELYDDLEKSNLTKLTGKYCEVVLTKPYTKTQLNSKLFLADFKPTSSMYKKYVEQKQVKGHVTLKKLKG